MQHCHLEICCQLHDAQEITVAEILSKKWSAGEMQRERGSICGGKWADDILDQDPSSVYDIWDVSLLKPADWGPCKQQISHQSGLFSLCIHNI